MTIAISGDKLTGMDDADEFDWDDYIETLQAEHDSIVEYELREADRSREYEPREAFIP